MSHGRTTWNLPNVIDVIVTESSVSVWWLSEAVKYVQEVPAVNFRREINFYAYMRGNKAVLL